jgi:hypothetical protein
VDVLVTRKDLRKAVEALMDAFPELTVNATPVVTRFCDPNTKQVVIDLMLPAQPVFQLVFRHSIRVGRTHRVPDLEMSLVSKFAAMVSSNREKAKQLLDAADFADIVTHNRQAVDLPRLRRLGERACPGAGARIVKLAEDIWAGRKIEL